VTTILAVQYDNGFVFAADSQITENERPYMHSDVKKITEDGDYVIAGAGNARFCDVVQYGWKLPRYDGTEGYRFMVSKVIPELKKAHDSTGINLEKEDGFSFLIGLDNKIYYVAEDYSVLRTDTGIYAMGTGGELALGAYHAGATIRQAMRTAIKFDVNSGGKIQIVKRGKQNG
jgi:ATP-dependent protease HslVU (ClpYQ) peptidase subunit